MSPLLYTYTMSSSKAGHCEQVALNKLPILMAGKITPKVLQAWEMSCLQFFWQKEITEKDQVGKIAWNLQDVHVCDWYNHDCDHLNSLTFEDFMKEVQSYWLLSDWVAWVCQKMLALTQGDKAFHVWAAVVQSQNVLLQGDKSHLSDDSLCYHLESHMHIDLIADYHSANVTVEKDLHKWIEKVRLLDEKCLCDVAKIETAMWANHQLLQSSCSVSAKPKDSKTATDGKPCNHIPPLTTEEQQLLQDNAGCFKCHQFFQNHTTLTCPNNFPDAKGYTMLTAADVEVAHMKKHAKPVAAIMEDEPTLKCHCSMEEQLLEPMAVIMPSAALGSSSELTDECVTPFTVPHLCWSCLLDGLNLDLSLNVDALIDQALLHPLHKLLDVSVAMSNKDHVTLTLSHFVQLSCLFLDAVFHSCTFHAIVAPGLCTPLLLGGPFLYVNCIDSSYNLLNPLAPPLMDVIQELKCLLPELKDRVDATCEPLSGVAVVTAVQHCVEQLAALKDLQKRDAHMKEEFTDHFPVDIPPIHELPDDVLVEQIRRFVMCDDTDKETPAHIYHCM
ncbi:hypothetical protein V8B97DRAFT_2024186 [Scleroderma yunnanense]